MTRHLFTFSLIFLAALSRLLPHLPNFTPIAALALFGGVYLDKKHTIIVPLAALLISDYFLGFYSGMMWVYGSFAAIGLLGLWLRKHQGVATTMGATLLSSILFFVVTNFGVWISSHGTYPLTFSGLIECYVAAIPFFRNSLLGDFAYVTALFGAYELAKKFVPSLSLQRQ
jgi:hypothetical protein